MNGGLVLKIPVESMFFVVLCPSPHFVCAHGRHWLSSPLGASERFLAAGNSGFTVNRMSLVDSLFFLLSVGHCANCVLQVIDQVCWGLETYAM